MPGRRSAGLREVPLALGPAQNSKLGPRPLVAASGPGEGAKRALRGPRNHLKSTAGQTSAEYVGVLLIVAGVIGSFFGSDLSDRVVTETQRAICRIASGGEPCDARANPQQEDANAAAEGEPDRPGRAGRPARQALTRQPLRTALH
jgi:hypothetical protein